jgi:hypothetical protein
MWCLGTEGCRTREWRDHEPGRGYNWIESTGAETGMGDRRDRSKNSQTVVPWCCGGGHPTERDSDLGSGVLTKGNCQVEVTTRKFFGIRAGQAKTSVFY